MVLANSMENAFRERQSGASPDTPCPNPDRLHDAALDRLHGDEFLDILDHTTVCPACATCWRLARDLESVSSKQEADSSGSFFKGGVLAAAAAVLFALAILALPQARRVSEPVFRNLKTPALISRTDEGVAVHRDNLILRWQYPTAGASYTVRLFNKNLRLLYQSPQIGATEIRIPVNVLEKVDSGDMLLWKVEAVLPDGTVVRSSTFVITLQ